MVNMIDEILRKCIKDDEMSLPRIADEIGINKSFLSRLVNGKSMQTKTADKLCEYYGLELKPMAKGKK
jgi:plasmid maintenance system antidote protein VapI